MALIVPKFPVHDKATGLEYALSVMKKLQARLRHAVRGRDDVIELILIALLADGHVLLEDFPGSGKTTLAKALGDAIITGGASNDPAPFRRIQFTPDLLPSDITGAMIFEPDKGTFHFRCGPIFAHVVLGDEINRTSPKVQAAMLEAMAEKQVTVDNTTYALGELFFVLATQNPRDTAGTYPLPIAQLDRFLFTIRMSHIDKESELDVLRSARERRISSPSDAPRVAVSHILSARRAMEDGVYVDDRIYECLVDIGQSLRSAPQVLQGVSTRSLVLMAPALQATALLSGRDYVTVEDVIRLAPRVFGHRIEPVRGERDGVDSIIEKRMAPAVERANRAMLRKRGQWK